MTVEQEMLKRKAFEILEQFESSDHRNADYDDAIDSIAQLMPRWVRVEDALPECLEDYSCSAHVPVLLINGIKSVDCYNYLRRRWEEFLDIPIAQWLDNCPEPPTD